MKQNKFQDNEWRHYDSFTGSIHHATYTKRAYIFEVGVSCRRHLSSPALDQYCRHSSSGGAMGYVRYMYKTLFVQDVIPQAPPLVPAPAYTCGVAHCSHNIVGLSRAWFPCRLTCDTLGR